MILTTAAATCLAMNIYFEARGEDYDGQKMIAEVTISRVVDDAFPDTICDVVWEPGAFSWTNDGKADRPRDKKAWDIARRIASETLIYGCELCTGAVYYHEKSISPYWADDMDVVGMWGSHIFYAND